jgi:Zn finger protein HypA/HybF involved in hydrogenase expression
MNLGDIIKLPKMRSVNGTKTCFMYQAQKNIGYNEAIKEIRDTEITGCEWCDKCGVTHFTTKDSVLLCPKCEHEN